MVRISIPKNRRIILITVVVLFCMCRAGAGKIIYVDGDATSTNHGTSWADAYWCLQDALADAQAGDEIRVANGIYKPDQEVDKTAREVQIRSSGDRTATFQLITGVIVKGGYAGFGEPEPDVRDIDLYETILSGDLNGDDGPDFTNNRENSYHVVTCSRTNPTAVLDGFTVTGGNANGPRLDNCGGGMFTDDTGNATIISCSLTGNWAGKDGGGIFCIKSSPTIENSIIAGNVTDHYGGGIHCDAFMRISNSVIVGNSAMYGGGIYYFGSYPTVTNCTIVGNFASGYGGGGIYCGNASPTVVNTILWNNRPDEIYLKQSSINVTYSDVQGGWSGEGNINANPLFVDADGVLGTEDDDLRLLPGSPCIDAGDNSAIPALVFTDLDGNPRITNGTVDMGAYEGVPQPNIYYVDAINGNDNNNGLTLQEAFANIQMGIDAAVDGEAVLVYPGLYQEEINFMGKALTVQGVVASPAGVPVLQNPGDYAVSFYSGEDRESILKNLIINDSFMGVFIAGSSPTISNLTIVNNKYGIEAYADSEPDISNCILWGNLDDDLFQCRARYSCIERASEGEGNITLNPLFVDPDNGDYHLRCERGRYWPEHDVWVLDKVTSPCIDGGDPNFDPSDEPMPNGGRINIGAYGGTVEASLSLSEQPCPLPGQASNPSPADGVIGVGTDVTLNWTAGLNALWHDVYFGTNPSLGTAELVSALQTDTRYQFVSSLAPGTTYYWRVDEFDGVFTHKGEVWSFTTADANIDRGIKGEYYKGNHFEELVLTRIDPQINFDWGIGGPNPEVGADDFSIKWSGEIEVPFTETYTFYTNSNGGVRLWIDGQLLIDRWWYDLHVSTEHSGTIDLIAGRTYSVAIDYQEINGIAVVELYWESPRTSKQLVPQAALSLPLKARHPNPVNGTTDLGMSPILIWNQGDYALSHDVYFGTDEQAVRNATRTSPEYKGTEAIGNESYNPGRLDWDTTYYWRIDEVNQANPGSPWKGNVWSFTTADFLVVDDFESYNDLDPEDPASRRIFDIWVDGWEDPNNGSIVGETFWVGMGTIVHSGLQAMPFSYDNSVGKSEATVNIYDLEIEGDWTIEDVGILSLWYRGLSDNSQETMYVVLNGTAGVDNDNPNATQAGFWTEWRIDLQEFVDQGVNLANVNSITLGLGNRSNPVAGGSGRMYFDDIRLYRSSWPDWPIPVGPEPPF